MSTDPSSFIIANAIIYYNPAFDGYYKKTYRYLMPAFKDIPIRELTPAMLREWIREFRLTRKTIQNALTPLRAVIAEALIDETIDKNPLANIILDKLSQ